MLQRFVRASSPEAAGAAGGGDGDGKDKPRETVPLYEAHLLASSAAAVATATASSSSSSSSSSRAPARRPRARVWQLGADELCRVVLRAAEDGDVRQLQQLLGMGDGSAAPATAEPAAVGRLLQLRDQWGWSVVDSAAAAGQHAVLELLLAAVHDCEQQPAAAAAAAKAHGADIRQLFAAAAPRARHNGFELLAEWLEQHAAQIVKVPAAAPAAARGRTASKPERGSELFLCEVCQTQVPAAQQREHNLSISHNLAMQHRPAAGSSFKLGPSNAGYKLLVKSGWDEASGLGPEGQGRVQPVKTLLKRDRLGLGRVQAAAAGSAATTSTTHSRSAAAAAAASDDDAEQMRKRRRATRSVLGTLGSARTRAHLADTLPASVACPPVFSDSESEADDGEAAGATPGPRGEPRDSIAEIHPQHPPARERRRAAHKPRVTHFEAMDPAAVEGPRPRPLPAGVLSHRDLVHRQRLERQRERRLRQMLQ